MSRHDNGIQGDGRGPPAVGINLKSCGLTNHQAVTGHPDRYSGFGRLAGGRDVIFAGNHRSGVLQDVFTIDLMN
jgi:hypothetical protein